MVSEEEARVATCEAVVEVVEEEEVVVVGGGVAENKERKE